MTIPKSQLLSNLNCVKLIKGYCQGPKELAGDQNLQFTHSVVLSSNKSHLRRVKSIILSAEIAFFIPSLGNCNITMAESTVVNVM